MPSLTSCRWDSDSLGLSAEGPSHTVCVLPGEIPKAPRQSQTSESKGT